MKNAFGLSPRISRLTVSFLWDGRSLILNHCMFCGTNRQVHNSHSSLIKMHSLKNILYGLEKCHIHVRTIPEGRKTFL